MNYTTFVFVSACAFLLSACGSQWSVTDQKFYKFQNHDVRVAAKVTLTEKQKPHLGKNGVDFGLRLYSGNFATLLTEVHSQVGEGLEGSGTTNVPAVVTAVISDFRLGGTSNSYPDFCAEILIERSNVPDWTRLNCINFNDVPSESPTGGLSLVGPEMEAAN